MSNVVYYIGVKGTDYVKIGTTKNLPARLRQLSTARADGNRLTVLATEPGSYELEQHRHAQFAASRGHGEWFALTPELQQHIDALSVRNDPSYVLGFDAGYQVALGDRNVINLISCVACGDEHAIPSGQVSTPGEEDFCLPCNMQTKHGIEVTRDVEGLVFAYGYEKAMEIAHLLTDPSYRNTIYFMQLGRH